MTIRTENPNILRIRYINQGDVFCRWAFFDFDQTHNKLAIFSSAGCFAADFGRCPEPFLHTISRISDDELLKAIKDGKNYASASTITRVFADSVQPYIRDTIQKAEGDDPV